MAIESGKLTSDASGGGTIKLSFRGDEIYGEGSGGSGVRIQVFDGAIGNFRVSGGSTYAVEGTCTGVDVDCSGGSAFKGGELLVKTAMVSTSGASTAYLNVENELSVMASGASSVSILGNPRVVKKDISSAASLRMQ